MRASPVIAGLVGLVLVQGCAGNDGLSVAAPQTVAEDGPAARAAALARLDARVGAVFFRLVTANLDLCPDKGRSAGWTLHAANQYSPQLRDVLTVDGDMRGDLPTVLAVAPDGPAATAGLVPGDVILKVGDQTMAVGTEGRPARYEGVAANLAILDAALVSQDTVRVTVRRDGGDLDLDLRPVAACAYSVHVEPSTALSARADGRGVFISTALVAFAASDDDLALILGHELAHNVLEHREKFDREAPARSVFGNLAVVPASLEAGERDADRTGLYLMARAGFAFEGAPAFWRAFGAANWRVRWAQWGHPTAERRAQLLEGAVQEIQELRAEGRPILP